MSNESKFVDSKYKLWMAERFAIIQDVWHVTYDFDLYETEVDALAGALEKLINCIQDEDKDSAAVFNVADKNAYDYIKKLIPTDESKEIFEMLDLATYVLVTLDEDYDKVVNMKYGAIRIKEVSIKQRIADVKSL